MALRSFKQVSPRLGPSVYVDETALVVGDVVLGADSSVWPMASVRGDVNKIRIGARTNIQDGTVIHVTRPYSEQPEGFATVVGDDVTVGHRCILHGCTIESRCLIGMGSIVLDGAVIRSGVLLGAACLVTEGKELEGGYLYLGQPAKRIRELTEAERAWFEDSARHYVKLKNEYL